MKISNTYDNDYNTLIEISHGFDNDLTMIFSMYYSYKNPIKTHSPKIPFIKLKNKTEKKSNIVIIRDMSILISRIGLSGRHFAPICKQKTSFVDQCKNKFTAVSKAKW